MKNIVKNCVFSYSVLYQTVLCTVHQTGSHCCCICQMIIIFLFRIVPRRATALVFSKSDEKILLADKAGDVHRFSVLDEGNVTGLAGTMVVGHVSMLLDVVSVY